jgi:hypothetical protein
LLPCAVLLATTGCLVTSRSKVYKTGVDVPDGTFEKIEPGTTTAAWVRATLGEPTSQAHDDHGGQVWTYAYTEHVDSSGYVFLIFGGSNVTETTRKAFVEFTGGVVVRKWRA